MRLRKTACCYTVEESVSMRETGERQQLRPGKNKDKFGWKHIQTLHRFTMS